jgi:predicted CXXCH cytochrome family protein
MKGLRFWLVIIASAMLTMGVSSMASAFHSGGVAECGGCHSMHAPMASSTPLLVGGDASSTCLSCHMNAADKPGSPSSYHVSTVDASLSGALAPIQRNPGGDFGWLKKDYTFTVRGTSTTEKGDTHGHNIVAGDYGYAADANNPTAPGKGGTFPSNKLGCQSCHDPHGKYRRMSDGSIQTSGAPIVGSGSYDTSIGNNSLKPIPANQAVGAYRLLAGLGYKAESVTYKGVPAAVAPATYNRTEAATQTRVAYGVATANNHVTWGQWCATCHPGMHSSGNRVHPVDQGMDSDMTKTYTNYVSSSDTVSGNFTANPNPNLKVVNMGPFTSLVPFMQNTDNYAALGDNAKNDGSRLAGPNPSDQVSCLSCHRAHASGFPEALRWNMEGEFMTYYGTPTGGTTATTLWPGIDNGAPPQFARGRTQAEMQAAYYDRDAKVFGPYQRVLCNKCHAKD